MSDSGHHQSHSEGTTLCTTRGRSTDESTSSAWTGSWAGEIRFDIWDFDLVYERWCMMLREHTGKCLFGPQSAVADCWRHGMDVLMREVPHRMRSDFGSPETNPGAKKTPRGDCQLG